MDYAETTANSNSGSQDTAIQMMLAAIETLPARYVVMKAALRECILSETPTTEIAHRHGYTGAALLYWIRKLRLTIERGGGRPVGASRRHPKGRASKRTRGRGERKTYPTPLRPRESRDIIVSFRLSGAHWARLLATTVEHAEPNLSAHKKAREIVVMHLQNALVGERNDHRA